MIKVGLSGNRYSGKTAISKMFKQIGIPVFDADIVLKFIIGHCLETNRIIKARSISKANTIHSIKTNPSTKAI